MNNHVLLCSEIASNRATQAETVKWRKIRSQSGVCFIKAINS